MKKILALSALLAIAALGAACTPESGNNANMMNRTNTMMNSSNGSMSNGSMSNGSMSNGSMSNSNMRMSNSNMRMSNSNM
ncbi:MAG: hypothetical protein ACR2N3_06180 [Pyrinomonadaceae bacterium]